MKNQIKSEGRRPDGSVTRTLREPKPGGLAGWLLRKLGSHSQPRPMLVVRERITLAPRQTLSLVEADGRKLLVATSPEGTPAFYALDERDTHSVGARKGTARTSW